MNPTLPRVTTARAATTSRVPSRPRTATAVSNATSIANRQGSAFQPVVPLVQGGKKQLSAFWSRVHTAHSTGTSAPTFGETIEQDQAWLRKSLAHHIVQNAHGIHEAHFSTDEYHPRYEAILRELGAEVVYVNVPSSEDHTLLQGVPGFFAIPAKMAWQRPAQMRKDYWAELPPQQAEAIQAQLQATHRLTVEIGAPTLDDYSWYRMNQKRDSSRSLFAWSQVKNDPSSYRSLRLRDPQTQAIVGVVVFAIDRSNMIGRMTDLVCDDAFPRDALLARVLVEAMDHLVQVEGISQIDAGIEDNFYGHPESLGAMEARVALGLIPRPGPERRFVKVLHSTTQSPEHFFFAEDDQGKLQGRYFSDQPRDLRVPAGVDVVHGSSSIPAVEYQALPDAFDLVRTAMLGDDSSQNVERLFELFTQFCCGGKRRELVAITYGGKDAPRSMRLLSLVHEVEQGRKHGDRFLAAAQVVLAGQSANPTAPLDFESALLRDPDFPARVAGFLGKEQHFEILNRLFFNLVRRQFGEISVLHHAHFENGSAMALEVFNRVRETYGVAATAALLQQVHEFIDLQAILENPQAYPPSMALSAQGRLELADLDLGKYFPPEHLDTAAELIGRLYRQMMQAHAYSLQSKLLPEYSLESSSLIRTQTMGGMVIAKIRVLLDEGFEVAQSDKDYDLPLVQEIFGELMILGTPPSLDDFNQDPVAKSFVSVLGNILASQSALIPISLFQADIDPKQIPMWGRSLKEILTEIYQRGTSAQLTSFVQAVQQHYPGNPKVRSLATTLEALEKEIPARPLAAMDIDATALQQTREEIVRLLRLCDSALLDFLVQKFQLRLSDNINDIIGTVNQANILIMGHIAQYGALPDLRSPEMFADLLRFGDQEHNHSFAAAWLLNRPELWREPFEEVAQLLEALQRHPQPIASRSLLMFLFKAGVRSRTAGQTQALLRRGGIRWGDAMIYARDLKGYFDEEVSQPADFDSENLLPDFARLLAQEIDEEVGKDANGWRRAKLFSLSLFVRIFPDFRKPFFDDLVQLAARDGELAIRGLCEFLENSQANALANLEPATSEEVQQLDQAFHRILSHAHCEYPSWWRDRMAALQGSPWFRQVSWPVGGFEKRTPLIEIWLESFHHTPLSEANAANLLHLTFGDPARPLNVADLGSLEKVLTAFSQASERQPIFVQLRDALQSRPLESGVVERLVALVESWDPQGEHKLFEFFFNADFVQSHPWRHYGFGEAVLKKIHTLASQADFTPRRALLLARLLFSHEGKAFHRLWIGQLMLGIPDQSFHTRLRFLQFWQSLSAEHRNAYLKDRVASLLEEPCSEITREAFGPLYPELKAAYEAAPTKTGKKKLLAKIHRLDQYRLLFQALHEAASPSDQAGALEKIHDAILCDFNPTIDPAAEQKLLSEHLFRAFFQKLDLPPAQGEALKEKILQNLELLSGSGILDRFVQYASFAEPEGIEMLKRVLDVFFDPAQTRILEVERPDLGPGRKTKHFDYQGKFAELESVLKTRGVAPDALADFLKVWKPLWHFQPVPNAPGEYLSVTHDLERWVKHGEEPRKSCQRLSDKSGNMSADNWNYQFGPNPNATGRPLARPLLPQLKLAEYRIDGKVVGRSVLEVTTQEVDGKQELALLVEAPYFADGYEHKSRAFFDQIKKYAEQLGIPESRVFFHTQAERAPAPLPEKYRIYRDFFRSEWPLVAG